MDISLVTAVHRKCIETSMENINADFRVLWVNRSRKP